MDPAPPPNDQQARDDSAKVPLQAPQPTVGRIVHYVQPDGQHRAAIITGIALGSSVNLTVFADSDEDFRGLDPRSRNVNEHHYMAYRATLVFFDGYGESRRSWHWPERA